MYITDNITPQNSNYKVCYFEYLFAEIVQFVSRRFEVPFLSRMFTRYIMYLFNPMFQRIWKYLMDKVSFLFIPSFFFWEAPVTKYLDRWKPTCNHALTRKARRWLVVDDEGWGVDWLREYTWRTLTFLTLDSTRLEKNIEIKRTRFQMYVSVFTPNMQYVYYISNIET